MNGIQLRAYWRRQLYFYKSRKKTTKAKATIEMYNEVINIEDNNSK